MRNKKMTKRIVLSALVALTFGSVAAGTTYALFTSEATTNVSVSTGKVKVDTSISNDSIQLSSLDSTTDTIKELTKDARTFTNGGSFSYDDKTGAITLNKFTPGDKVEFTVNAKNSSTVNIKYRTVLKVLSDNGLFQGLKVTVNGTEYDGSTTYSNYESLTANTDFTNKTYKFSIELPKEAGNEYQEKTCQITFNIEAIQGNAKVSDPDQTVYQIYTPLDLAAFAKKVNAGTLTATKVILMNDIDMSGIKYVSPHLTKYIEFDGQSHVIKNFAPIQSRDASNNQFIGLIGKVGSGDGVHVHDIIFDNVKIEGDFTDYTITNDPHLGGAAVVGMTGESVTKEIKIENIQFKNGVAIDHVKYGGSVFGYTTCKTEISNITFNDTATIKGYTVGGVLGQVGDNSTTISNVTVVADENNTHKISVEGYRREGGIVGAVSDGEAITLALSTVPTSDKLSISGKANANSGNYVGLANRTTIDGHSYYNVNNDTELQSLRVDKTKSAVVEIGEGSYNGYSADFENVTGGVKVVGRGDKTAIKWIQAKEDNNGNSGYSFSGTAVQMENLTLTSAANGFYTGFPGAASTSFNNVEILVDHEKGAMGYWGNSTATFTNCSFITPNHVPESNIFAYGGETFIFSKCHFISEESSIKLYRDKATTPKTITIKVDEYCTFKSTCEKSDGAAEYKSVFYMHMDHASTDYNHYDIKVAKFDVGSIEECHNVEGNFAKGYSVSHPKLIGWKATATNESYYSDHLTIKVGDSEVTDLGFDARPTGNA